MDDFDIISLLKTNHGIACLQSSLEENCIQLSLKRSESGYYNLDFGLNCIEDLEFELELPFGYEEESRESDRKKLTKNFSIINCSPNVIAIKNVVILPNNSSSLPVMSVYINDINITHASNKSSSIKCNPNEELLCRVELLLSSDFNGFLGRWIVFLFEMKYLLSSTFCQTCTFVYGLRTFGCVNKKTSSRMKLLSSEAKIFRPQSVLTYFDEPCISFSFGNLVYKYLSDASLSKLEPPYNYQFILKSLHNCNFVISNDFLYNYTQSTYTGQLELFMKSFCSVMFSTTSTSNTNNRQYDYNSDISNINNKTNEEVDATQLLYTRLANVSPMDVLLASNNNNANTATTSSSKSLSKSDFEFVSLWVIKYIQTLGNMLWMEEAQMSLDVLQYDALFLEIIPSERHPYRSVLKNNSKSIYSQTYAARTRNTSNSNSNSNYVEDRNMEKIVVCKMKIKGSNESRPRIAVGDRIRLRPMSDDLFQLNNKLHSKSSANATAASYIHNNNYTNHHNCHYYDTYKIPMYELEGIVLDFTLSTETAVVEFIIPPMAFFYHDSLPTSTTATATTYYNSNDINAVNTNIASAGTTHNKINTETVTNKNNSKIIDDTPADTKDVNTSFSENHDNCWYTSITYQARFSFERSGFILCHIALVEVMKSPILRACLFPYLHSLFLDEEDTKHVTPNEELSLFNSHSQSHSHNNKYVQGIDITEITESVKNSKTLSVMNKTKSKTKNNHTKSTTNSSNQTNKIFNNQTNSSSLEQLNKNIISHNFYTMDPSLYLNIQSSSPSSTRTTTTTTTVTDHMNNEEEIISVNNNVNDDESQSQQSVMGGFNDEQLKAIHAIVNYPDTFLSTCSSSKHNHNHSHRNNTSTLLLPPFIIFGPPGTGKTITIIEGIVQLLKFHPTKRVLACAPSDSAADILCQRLKIHFSTKELLRLNWWQRLKSSVPVDIIAHTYQNEQGLFEVPCYEDILQYRIIVCTCGTSGILKRLHSSSSSSLLSHTNNNNSSRHNRNNNHNNTMKSLEFDLVVIDEAGQATEAETYCPVSLCKTDGTGLIVLAGDPQQLGPMTRSAVYQLWGGPTSLLERLLSYSMYSISTANNQNNNNNSNNNSVHTNNNSTTMTRSSLVVFLTKNYRSHRCILKLSSKLFYNDSMEEYGESSVINSLLTWNQLSSTSTSTSHMTSTTTSTSSSGQENQVDTSAASAVIMTTTTTTNTNSSSANASGGGFPLLFYGVNGQHDHELDSPSFYNLDEIDAIVMLCRSLLNNDNFRISPMSSHTNNTTDDISDNDDSLVLNDDEVEDGDTNTQPNVSNQKNNTNNAATTHNATNERNLVDTSDIGIICAFRAQVLKLRKTLRSLGLGNINVGSVEDFQGQEMKIIIISTVLSRKVPAFEMNGCIGLLGDRKKFNVAISRGMALCVVVGQPYLLYADPYFKEYMEYCDENGTCQGFPCELLKSKCLLRAAKKEDDEEWELINLAAQVSVLGEGYTDEQKPTNLTSYYFNSETQWRVLL